jgi:ketosteroid isomerase-like protein
MTVADRLAISDLVHRYADAVVHRDAAQWGSCWADDARWILDADRDVTGRAAIVATWTAAMDRFECVVQNVVNGAVRFGPAHGDAASATGRWYILEHFQRRDGSAGLLLAYYDDTYLSVGDSWLFASRELVIVYHGAPDLSAEFVRPLPKPG